MARSPRRRADSESMTYKIGFFSDTHIDYSAGRKWTADGVNQRAQDGINALVETVTQMIEEQVDLVIHGGDLFHTSIPTVRGIVAVREQFDRLHKAGIPVYGITGNHDFPNTRLRLPATAAVSDPDRNVTILTDPMGIYRPVEGLTIHAVSHAGLLGTPVAPNPIDGDINILISHGAADIEGHEIFHCVDSPAEAVIPRDTLSQNFDATLLGHYHGQGPLPKLDGTKNRAFYAGSALRRGFSDSAGKRGWLLVIIADDGSVRVGSREIWQRPQYDLAEINADEMSGEELESVIRDNLTTVEWGTTPIVRQRIINCPLSTRRGVDTKAINDIAAPALSWQLEFQRPEDPATDGESDSMTTIRKASLTEAWGEFVATDPHIIPKHKDDVAERGKDLLDGNSDS